MPLLDVPAIEAEPRPVLVVEHLDAGDERTAVEADLLERRALAVAGPEQRLANTLLGPLQQRLHIL
jgi:hypothetical protein